MLVYEELKFRYIWVLLVTISTSILALLIPFNLALQHELTMLNRLLYWGASLVLLADFIYIIRQLDGREKSTFQTTYTRKHYLRTWLIVDLLPVIPFSLFPGLAILDLLKFLKLARVNQYMRRVKEVEVRFSTILTLSFFLFWAVLLAHWLSCGWLSIRGPVDHTNHFGEYINSLYWVCTTMTAVGYGDIVPETNTQKLYGMLVQLTGIAVFGYLIGNLVGILSKRDSVAQNFNKNMERLRAAVHRRNLPPELQKRILDYYFYLRDEKVGYDESAFLESLPKTLRTEVALSLKKEFIEEVPILKNAGEKFISEIALKLDLIVATSGDFIFRAGDVGKDMFFIVSGNVEVLDAKEEKVLNVLKEGDYFGEIALFMHNPRTASIRALTYCNLYKLSSKTFKKVIANYPEIAKELQETALQRERSSKES